MTYRAGQILPLYAYSNEYSSNKNLGGDAHVNSPYSFGYVVFPADLAATDVIHFRGGFNNSGNDWDLKLWFCPQAGTGSVYQTETFQVPTADYADYPVVEGRVTPNADFITSAAAGEPCFLYMGAAQTASAASGYSVHGFTMWLERRL